MLVKFNTIVSIRYFMVYLFTSWCIYLHVYNIAVEQMSELKISTF